MRRRGVAVDAVLKALVVFVLGYRGPFIPEGKMPDALLADTLQQKACCWRSRSRRKKLGTLTPRRRRER